MTEKFIEEQQKFYNFYNIKKNYEKKSQEEFLDLLTKKGNELFKLDMLDISLISKNIESLSEQLNSQINQSRLENVICSGLSNL